MVKCCDNTSPLIACSFLYNYGNNTLSITCTTPLRHIRLVPTILERLTPLPFPLMVGPPPAPFVKLIVVFPPASIDRLPFARSDEKALPPTTWYLNTANNVPTGILFISVRLNALKSWVNAALVGANTVSVAELNVAIKVGSPPGALLALTMAFTSESKPDPGACAVATILPDGLFKALDKL